MAKLTAVANWERPQNIQNQEGFLGLTGYFHSLIKDYARIERPLRDLKTRYFTAPMQGGHQAYKQVAVACSLKDTWTPEHIKAFVRFETSLAPDGRVV